MLNLLPDFITDFVKDQATAIICVAAGILLSMLGTYVAQTKNKWDDVGYKFLLELLSRLGWRQPDGSLKLPGKKIDGCEKEKA